MATTQVEGIASDANTTNVLVQWLKRNNLNDPKLIAELMEEGVEDVDDLLIFDENQLKERLINKGIKIGVISKLIKLLKKQRQETQSKNDASGANASIIMLDKNEKDAVQKLQSELLQTGKKLQLLPEKRKRISSMAQLVKNNVSDVCNEWIKLIQNHEKSLHEWIDTIQQQQEHKCKTMQKTLNDELHLIQETKQKCQRLMTFASMDDIWAAKPPNSTDDDVKDNIVSLVDKCVSELDKCVTISHENVFDKLKFVPHDASKVQDLLSQNIGKLVPPKLVVNTTDVQIEFLVQDEETPYDTRELYVKIKEQNDEKVENKEVKLPITDDKHSINIEELDQKLGEHEQYVAYVESTLANLKASTVETSFNVHRTKPSNIEIAASEYVSFYGDKPDISNGFAEKAKDVSGFKYKINIPKNGEYVVWVYVGKHPYRNKSYGSWDDFDGQSVKTHVWYKKTDPNYMGQEWIKSSSQNLTKGEHIWMFGSRKDENHYIVPWSKFVITADLNFVP